MNRRFLTALFCIAVMTLPTVGALAQAADAEQGAEQTEENTSMIKRMSIAFFGGYNSGDTYFQLPIMDERAQLAEHSNLVYMYDGTTFDIGNELTANGLTAPEKKIDSGNTYGAKIGFYLSDNFHIDIGGSISKGEAKLTALKLEDWEPQERILLSSDDKFTLYMGGMELIYDLHNMKILGLTPYFGLGLGGVINRFDVLEDQTSLYFQFLGGLSRPITDSIGVDVGLRAATYSFQTDDQEYSEQVTNLQLTGGITFLFDVKPIHDLD